MAPRKWLSVRRSIIDSALHGLAWIFATAGISGGSHDLSTDAVDGVPRSNLEKWPERNLQRGKTIMNQIKPYSIWVGHAGDGSAFTEIFANEIRAVVQVAAEEAAIQPPRDLIFFRLPLIDGTGNDPDMLQLAIS